MGVKIIQTSMTLSFLSATITLICCTQTWHSNVFSAFLIPSVIRMETSATKLRVGACSPGTSTGAFFRKISSFCNTMPEAQDLQDFYGTACSGMFTVFFPTMCSAMHYAYVLGLVLLIATVFNVVLQGVGVFMAYQYMSGSLKKRYRELWTLLLCFGAAIQLVAVIVYQFLAIEELDNLRTNIPYLSAGKGAGTTLGFIFFFIAIFLELIAIVLTKYAKLGDEDFEAERRENAKFLNEVDAFNQATNAASPNSQQGVANYGSGQDNCGANGYGDTWQQEAPPPQQWEAPPQQWEAPPAPQTQNQPQAPMQPAW